MINEIYLLTHPYSQPIGIGSKDINMWDFHKVWVDSIKSQKEKEGVFSIITLNQITRKEYRDLEGVLVRHADEILYDSNSNKKLVIKENDKIYPYYFNFGDIIPSQPSNDLIVTARGVDTVGAVLESARSVCDNYSISKENAVIMLSESIDPLTTDLNIESKHVPTYNSMKEQWGSSVNLAEIMSFIDVKLTDRGYTKEQRNFK